MFMNPLEYFYASKQVKLFSFKFRRILSNGTLFKLKYYLERGREDIKLRYLRSLMHHQAIHEMRFRFRWSLCSTLLVIYFAFLTLINSSILISGNLFSQAAEHQAE